MLKELVRIVFAWIESFEHHLILNDNDFIKTPKYASDINLDMFSPSWKSVVKNCPSAHYVGRFGEIDLKATDEEANKNE